ncbi:MAG: hypothetical protein ACRCYO_12430, partial [Bacteroidia bacterium]
MSLFLRFLLFFFMFSHAFVTNANPIHSKKDRKVWRQAEEHFTYSEYDEALPLFLRLVEKDPENSQLNYKLGICYYFSTTSRPLCVPYYERALAHAGRDTTSDLLYHAGVGFLTVNHFAQAQDLFARLNRRREGMNYTELRHLMQSAENGIAAWKNPARIRIRNLGRNINSPYPDYAPVITPDQSMLLFTSKRKGTTGGRRDDDGYYYEDVYQSRNLASKRWGASDRYDTNFRARHFGPFLLFFARAENVTQINTNDHDGSISLAPDGKKLFIYRYSDIWEADWAETGWKKPKRMGKAIDARASHEPSVCISPDGKTLFFVSDRKGSMGGKDIWYCSRAADNSWEKPRNLGRNFNTEYNEDAPCLTADGNTLYFASEGHNSMGGYDIFKSKKLADGNWSPAENLGAP